MEDRTRAMFQRRQQEAPLYRPSDTSEKFIQNAQEFLADAYTGRDVTRPRDIYTFLSLGRVPTNLRSRGRLKSRSVNNDARKVTFGSEEVIPRRNSFEGIPASAYFKFDVSEIGLEPLPPISASGSRPVSNEAWGSKPVTPFQHIVAEDLAGEIRNSIPISLVKGYHKVNLSKTYIFAPTERLDETLKYSPKVVLPKIKTSDSEREEIVPPSVLTLDSIHNVDAIHDKKFEVINVLSPRKDNISNINMELSSSLFGVRPECVFLTSQLGDKNPLLRDQSKSTTEPNVPKVVPGLHDLKDYAGYPKEYWKLRSEKISQPADLEADMIDRDLYRLRQLSALKLNSIERTYPIKNDPFKKWHRKGGEPLFSPNQQQVPHRRRRQKYGIHSLSGSLTKSFAYKPPDFPTAFTITPLKISTNDAIQEEDESEETGEKEDTLNPTQAPVRQLTPGVSHLKPNRSIHMEEMNKTNTSVTSIATDPQREAVVDQSSLKPHRKPVNGIKQHTDLRKLNLTVQKQHELRRRRDNNKQMLKTPVISVDLDSIDSSMKTSRTLNHNTARLLNLHYGSAAIPEDPGARETELSPAEVTTPHPDTTDAGDVQNQNEAHSAGKNPEQTNGTNQKHSARVMSLNFNPPPNFTTPLSYPDYLIPLQQQQQQLLYQQQLEQQQQQQQQQDQQISIQSEQLPPMTSESREQQRTTHYTTPVESRGECTVDSDGNQTIIISINTNPANLPSNSKSNHPNTKTNNGNKARAVHQLLEVFSERKEEINSPAPAASSGRTSYHPEMPAYRLDLVNYPPINPRQTCRASPGRLSHNLGGVAGTNAILGATSGEDGRSTTSKHRDAPGSARQHPDRRLEFARAMGTSESVRRAGSAGPAVEIRFGQQGEVILSSSREKRGQRTSR